MADRVADGSGSSDALNCRGLGTTAGASAMLVSLPATASLSVVAGGVSAGTVALIAATAMTKERRALGGRAYRRPAVINLKVMVADH